MTTPRLTEENLRRIVDNYLSTDMARAASELLALRRENKRLRAAERDKLAAFKKWVHDYLDAKGIPHHPPGTHGAEGCRIGDRMDYVFAQLAEAKAAPATPFDAEAFVRKCMEYEESIGRIQTFSERVQARKQDVSSLVAELRPHLRTTPGAADDGEAVTDEFVRQLGWINRIDGLTDPSNVLTLDDYGTMTVTNGKAQHCTRGQLRALLAALAGGEGAK